VSALSSFKVVMTVIRGPEADSGPLATVTVTGYRHTGSGWKAIANKQIGKADQWFWYPTEVCGLTVTELKAEPSSAVTADTVEVSLLITPAIGCSKTYAERWRP
jgi:hypothetical protein